MLKTVTVFIRAGKTVFVSSMAGDIRFSYLIPKPSIVICTSTVQYIICSYLTKYVYPFCYICRHGVVKGGGQG